MAKVKIKQKGNRFKFEGSNWIDFERLLNKILYKKTAMIKKRIKGIDCSGEAYYSRICFYVEFFGVKKVWDVSLRNAEGELLYVNNIIGIEKLAEKLKEIEKEIGEWKKSISVIRSTEIYL